MTWDTIADIVTWGCFTFGVFMFVRIYPDYMVYVRKEVELQMILVEARVEHMRQKLAAKQKERDEQD